MSDHPEFVAIKARHTAEIDELTTAFSTRYAELIGAEPHMRDVPAINALRKKHVEDIREAVGRHTGIENAWREPEASASDEPARFVGSATTLDEPKDD